MEEIDVPSLRGASSSSSDPDGTANTAPSSSTPLAPDAHLPIPSANAFGQSPFPSASNTLSTEPAAIASSRASGSKEADGGWDISWCKDHYWGEILAVAAGTDGLVKVCLRSVLKRAGLNISIMKIIQLSPSRRPTVLLVLDKSSKGHSSPITSVAWAPACGRSYQLIATGSRDGFVRIWQVQPPPLNDDLAGFSAAINGEDEGSWTGRLVGDFHHHECVTPRNRPSYTRSGSDTHLRSLVSRVEWNVTGTILSSAGNDGKVRLWKRSLGATWRSAGFVSVEAAEQDDDAVMSERPQHD
jgi:nucleoporin SEH1